MHAGGRYHIATVSLKVNVFSELAALNTGAFGYGVVAVPAARGCNLYRGGQGVPDQAGLITIAIAVYHDESEEPTRADADACGVRRGVEHSRYPRAVSRGVLEAVGG